MNILTLADAPSFPVQIDGHHAVNDPKKLGTCSADTACDTDNCRYFVGGVINQRTSLIIRSGTVVGGFGSVCDFFNYTGMLVGVDKTSAAVTQVYAMEGGPGAIPETNNLQGDGGRAGVWMGGMGFSSDGQGRIYFVTGKSLSTCHLHELYNGITNFFLSFFFFFDFRKRKRSCERQHASSWVSAAHHPG